MQVAIALIVTPEVLLLAYEVLPGNTLDHGTLREFLDRIEAQYGKARRTWVMDRGIPTEAVLEEMRASDPPVHYLVGTPKGRLSKLEKDPISRPWQAARPGVQVKLLPREGELYVFAQSEDRVAKERAMRQREIRYLLRTDLSEGDPTELWNYYLQLAQVEEAFGNLKGDLAIRPLHHRLEGRIEAHIFIAFLAYSPHVTLMRQLHAHAPGLTPRAVLEKFAAIQMADIHIPTTDGRELVLTRYTQPEPEIRLLPDRLNLELPVQAPPIKASAKACPASPV